ncbi:MAG: SH3 domain-containing protein [Hyphomicrobiaceae bacterium]
MKTFLISASALVLWVAAASALAAPGTALRNDRLYSQPSAASKVAGSVAKGASVDIVAKQGGWLRVTSGKSTGWIRLLSVRVGAGGLGGVGLGDVMGAATTRSNPSRVVAVAGLRGLNEEDLKQAKFNSDELARLNAWHVTPAQARSFAAQAGLKTTNVAALPAPQSAQTSSPWESN